MSASFIVALAQKLGLHADSVDVLLAARGVGGRPSALADALRLVDVGEPVFAQIAPGNAAAFRAALGARFAPIGGEVLFFPATSEVRVVPPAPVSAISLEGSADRIVRSRRQRHTRSRGWLYAVAALTVTLCASACGTSADKAADAPVLDVSGRVGPLRVDEGVRGQVVDFPGRPTPNTPQRGRLGQCARNVTRYSRFPALAS